MRIQSMNEDFVIPVSLIGPPAGISNATVRQIVRKLELSGEIEVMRTPTGRSRVNSLGYQRIRQAINAKSAA